MTGYRRKKISRRRPNRWLPTTGAASRSRLPLCFISAQLAESTLELAEKDLKSFQQTVDISEAQYKDGGLSENDYLMIKLQLLQFEADRNRRSWPKCSRCRICGNCWDMNPCPQITTLSASFDYQPVKVNLEDLQMKALQNRPDLRAAQQGVTAANSQ